MTLAEADAIIARDVPNWQVADRNWSSTAPADATIDVVIAPVAGQPTRRTVVVRGGYVVGVRK